MRALLVHAEFPPSYWGFQHSLSIVGKRTSLPPLGLVTVAAHLPAHWQLRVLDLNATPLSDAALSWADVVLVGGMLVQVPSMRTVLARARALGRRTVVGGPAATTAPELLPADVVFGGEIEGRAAELVAAIEASGPCQLPRPTAFPDITESRPPRYDLLDLGHYVSLSVQYSRGCPFACEFCDVIEIFGRKPRVKSAAQVLAELDALFQLGWRGSLFMVDDNFIGNQREVRRLLPELERWQEAHGRPFELYTEASVNLAGEPELLAAMVAAGFRAVFVGIETPSAEALRSAGKLQNLKLDLGEAVRILTRAGLEVMGGFIVGFDSDTPAIFESQARFLRDAPIPLAMVGILAALPGTALWRRLGREGRLRTSADGDAFARPNFVPAMDEGTLLRAYGELLQELYSSAGYHRRLRAFLALAEPLPTPPRQGGVRILLRAMWWLGVRGRRRRAFWSLLLAALRRSRHHVAWAIVKAVQGEHLIRYTEEDVMPRLRRAIADIGREQSLAAVRAQVA